MQETPETRAKLANAITTLRSQGREGEVSSLVSQYKAKYRPETIERSATAPEAALQGAAKTYKTLENVGQGAALSVGNLGTGIVGGALKLAGKAGISGANTAAQGVENFRQKAFVQPTMESQQTFAGKLGKVGTDVLSYMTPGGLPARIGTSAAVGFGQSGGDVKAGIASGVVEGLTGGLLSKIPGVKNVISKIPLNKTANSLVKTLAPGYTSDVVQGVAGQRGEDRTGVAALLPGAGTVFSGVLGAGVKGVKTVQKARNPQSYVADLKSEWKISPKETKAGFYDAKEIYESASKKGHNIEDTLVSNNIFRDNFVVDKKVQSIDAAKTLRKQTANNATEILRPQLDKIKNDVPKIDPRQVILKAKSKILGNKLTVNKDKITKSIDDAISELKREYPNGMSPADIFDKKIAYDLASKPSVLGDIASNIEAQKNKAIADVLRGEIDKLDIPGLDIRGFQKEQQRLYQAANYLEALHGTKPSRTFGETVRNTIAKGVGATIGSSLGAGVLPSLAGYHLAGTLEGAASNFVSPFKKAAMSKLTPKVPSAIQNVQNYSRPNRASMNSPIPNATNAVSNIPISPNYTTLQRQNILAAEQLDNQRLIDFAGKNGDAVRSIEEMQALRKNLVFPTTKNGKSTIPKLKKK